MAGNETDQPNGQGTAGGAADSPAPAKKAVKKTIKKSIKKTSPAKKAVAAAPAVDAGSKVPTALNR